MFQKQMSFIVDKRLLHAKIFFLHQEKYYLTIWAK
ncbi:Uncharacterised protein [Escherichia coli]|uniref:Uncharacterized protein n=1 Tax=Escherichia coli TaxID=562 RepID=A0A377C7W1_ECOLX|nr:Uncharacterised protein [Escherichia coli]